MTPKPPQWAMDEAKGILKGSIPGPNWVEPLLDGIATALAKVRTDALEEAAKVCAGPDAGYLHGCSCRSAVTALKEPT